MRGPAAHLGAGRDAREVLRGADAEVGADSDEGLSGVFRAARVPPVAAPATARTCSRRSTVSRPSVTVKSLL